MIPPQPLTSIRIPDALFRDRRDLLHRRDVCRQLHYFCPVIIAFVRGLFIRARCIWWAAAGTKRPASSFNWTFGKRIRASVLTIISITLPFNLSINYFPRSRLRRFLWRSWFILWEREREIQRIPFTMQKGKGMAVLPSYDLFHLECCYTYMCIYTFVRRNSDYSRNVRYWMAVVKNGSFSN